MQSTPYRALRARSPTPLNYPLIRRSVIGDEGVALLADGLRRGRLPSLRDLRLVFAKIGHRFSPSRLSLPPAAALVIVRIALRRALDRCY